MNHKIQLGLAVMALIIAGFLREYIFVNINAQLYVLWYSQESRIQDITGLSFLASWTYYPLYSLKWVLTVLFVALYAALSIWTLYALFKKNFFKEVTFIYGMLIGLSILVMIVFYLMGDLDEGYFLTRFVMGIAQSPIPLMLLVPAIYVRMRTNQTKQL